MSTNQAGLIPIINININSKFCTVHFLSIPCLWTPGMLNNLRGRTDCSATVSVSFLYSMKKCATVAWNVEIKLVLACFLPFYVLELFKNKINKSQCRNILYSVLWLFFKPWCPQKRIIRQNKWIEHFSNMEANVWSQSVFNRTHSCAALQSCGNINHWNLFKSKETIQFYYTAAVMLSKGNPPAKPPTAGSWCNTAATAAYQCIQVKRVS